MGIAIYPTTVAYASFRSGDEGTEICELQERLISLGYDVAIADGVFGEETVLAIKKYQQDVGLSSDGIVGRDTYSALMGREMTSSRGGLFSGLVRELVNISFQYIGVPYVFGGTSPWGFDCSGFTQYVFSEAGINLSRMADEQFNDGQQIASSELRPGDLVFFETYDYGPSHVGIYIGNGEFVHAGTSTGVTVSDMYDGYWGARYYGACRVM